MPAQMNTRWRLQRFTREHAGHSYTAVIAEDKEWIYRRIRHAYAGVSKLGIEDSYKNSPGKQNIVP